MSASCAHLTPEDVRALETTRDWGKAIDYLREPRGWVREEAARVLGRMRAAETRATLETVLADRKERSYVRAAAAESLAEIGDRLSIGTLVGVAGQKESPPEVKIAVLGALCAFAGRGEETMHAIAELEKDDDVLVAAYAESSTMRCRGEGRSP
jgi:HEAT repeat protein